MLKAKRLAPSNVNPVSEGDFKVSCKAHNNGEIKICNTKTSSETSLQVYSIKYNPSLERDVQDDHINKLEIKNGVLHVHSEKGHHFTVTLATNAITKIK